MNHRNTVHRYGSIPVPLAQLGAGGSSIAVVALISTRALLSAEIVSLLNAPRVKPSSEY